MYCENKQHTWDEFLPQLLMAYRSSVHSSTGQIPNRMTWGREITMPVQIVVGRTPDRTEIIGAATYVTPLANKLQQAYHLTRKRLKTSTDYQKRHYDLKAKKQSLKNGQHVWVYDPARKVGVWTKLISHWKGPFIVIKKIDDVSYKIMKSKAKHGLIYHINRLAPYRGTNQPTWISLERELLQRRTDSLG